MVCSIRFMVAPKSPLSASTLLKAPSTADKSLWAPITVFTLTSDILVSEAAGAASLFSALEPSAKVVGVVTVKTLGDW